MNQQEKPGPAARPGEGAGGVAGLRALSWGGQVYRDTDQKHGPHYILGVQGNFAFKFLYTESKNTGVGVRV